MGRVLFGYLENLREDAPRRTQVQYTAGSMEPDLPNDADGGAIRRVFNGGSDPRRPMVLDFHIAAPSEQMARQVAEAAAALKYHAKASPDEDDEDSESWTVTCTTRTLLTYRTVIAMQAELHNLAEPLGASVEGWATWGNC